MPPDANTLLSVTDHCLRSRKYVNVIVAGKQPAPQWLGIDQAVTALMASGWSVKTKRTRARPYSPAPGRESFMTVPSQSGSELAHDILRPARQPLDVFFSPTTVAVVGATETAGSVGRTVLWNLISSPCGATIYPVNPKRPSVLGIKAYPK